MLPPGFINEAGNQDVRLLANVEFVLQEVVTYPEVGIDRNGKSKEISVSARIGFAGFEKSSQKAEVEEKGFTLNFQVPH